MLILLFLCCVTALVSVCVNFCIVIIIHNRSVLFMWLHAVGDYKKVVSYFSNK